MEKQKVVAQPTKSEAIANDELNVVELDDRLDMTLDPVSALLLAGDSSADTINNAYTC